jgi:signal transduction histidine kinase
MRNHRTPVVSAGLAALFYAVVASVWILVSDRLVASFSETVPQLAGMQTTKGLLFVTVTSGLLFMILRSALHRSEKLQAEARLAVADAAEAEARSARRQRDHSILLTQILLAHEADPRGNAARLVEALGNLADASAAAYVGLWEAEPAVLASWIASDSAPTPALSADSVWRMVANRPGQAADPFTTEGTQHFYCQPAMLAGEAVAVLCICFPDGNRPDEQDQRLLRLVSEAIAVEVRRRRAEEAAQIQRELAEALSDSAAALTSTLDVEEVLDRILASAGRVLPHEAANIMMLDGDAFVVVRATGYERDAGAEPLTGRRFDVAALPIMQEAVASSQPLVVADTRSAAAWFPLPDAAWVLSSVTAPVSIRGRVIGLLNLDASVAGHFQPADARRLSAFADQAGIAMANAQLLREAERRSKELAALYEMAVQVGSSLESEMLFATVRRAVRSLVDCESLVVARHDTGSGETRIARADVASDDGSATAPQLEPEVHRRLLAYVASHREPLLIGQAGSAGTSLEIGVELPTSGSWLGVPLIARDRVVGAIAACTRRDLAFSDADRLLLEALAAPLALAWDNAELYAAGRRHAAILESQVSSRTAELKAANAQLRELDVLKSRFISNVSHELRTPLANVKTHLYLLARSAPEKREQHLDTINREIDLLNQLIEELLHLSRLESNRLEMELQPLDLNRLARALADDRRRLLQQRGIQLNVDFSDSMPTAMGDHRLVTQVLTNLMTNAMNYTPSGRSVTLVTALRGAPGQGAAALTGLLGDQAASRLLPESDPTPTLGGWCTLAVLDTGPGMSGHELGRLFNRFFRGEAARAKGTAGTGLGLSICLETMRRLGGFISVETLPDRGSAFTIWLPATQPQ